MSSGAHSNYCITEKASTPDPIASPCALSRFALLPPFRSSPQRYAHGGYSPLSGFSISAQRLSTAGKTTRTQHLNGTALSYWPGVPVRKRKLEAISCSNPTCRPSTPANSFSSDQPACARVALDAGEAMRRRCQYTLDIEDASRTVLLSTYLKACTTCTDRYCLASFDKLG
jgi:hypothetical protein